MKHVVLLMFFSVVGFMTTTALVGVDSLQTQIHYRQTQISTIEAQQ